MANIKVKNARLSFPSLFTKASFDGTTAGKYEATFLIPKKGNEEWYKKTMAQVEALKAEKKMKVPSDKTFIKDGDDIEYDGYAGCWAVKASNTKRPTTIDGDKVTVVEDDEVFYAGCYVNGIIEPWAQNNQYGKRINANLLGVQFVKDGEPFGDGATVADVDDFDAVDDEEF